MKIHSSGFLSLFFTMSSSLISLVNIGFLWNLALGVSWQTILFLYAVRSILMYLIAFLYCLSSNVYFQDVFFIRISGTNIQQRNRCLYFSILHASHTRLYLLHNSVPSLILFSQICHSFNLFITVTGPYSLGDAERKPKHYPCEDLLSCSTSNHYQIPINSVPKMFQI